MKMMYELTFRLILIAFLDISQVFDKIVLLTIWKLSFKFNQRSIWSWSHTFEIDAFSYKFKMISQLYKQFKLEYHKETFCRSSTIFSLHSWSTSDKTRKMKLNTYECTLNDVLHVKNASSLKEINMASNSKKKYTGSLEGNPNSTKLYWIHYGNT